MSDLGRYEALADELEGFLTAPALPIAKTVGRAMDPQTAAQIDGIVKPAVLICPLSNLPTGRKMIGNRTVETEYGFLIAIVTEATFTEQGHKKAVTEAWRLCETVRDLVHGKRSMVANKATWEWGGEQFSPAAEDDAHCVMVARYTTPGTVGND